MSLTPRLFGRLRGTVHAAGDVMAPLDAEWTAFVENQISPIVRNARDFAALNRHANELNAEAADLLTFQTLPED
jgi:hypothetical protein